jgi:ribose transport system substrate-binding protein
LIKAMGGKGNVVHLAGLLVDPNTTLRVKAVETPVAETNGAVKLLQTIGDTDAQEAADQKINALLAAQKDQIGGMIATGYIPSVVASKSLPTLGDKRIKFIGIDDDPIVLDAIKDGFVSGTMAQNPYGQGYIRAHALDLLANGTCTVNAAAAPWIKTPQTARFIDSGTMVVNTSNLNSYKDDLKIITAEIQGKFKTTYLSCK